MNVLSYIFPQTITSSFSPTNGEIKVIEYFGKKALYVDGAPQSGAEITPMWEKIISKIKNQKSKIKNCLVLGVGGGDVIKAIRKYYPEAKITAVEIDPIMIEIAKKYFGLETSDTYIIVSDAISWVKNSKKKFDLIIIDLFIGKLNPSDSHGRFFLSDLKRLSATHGFIVFNGHYQENNPDEYKKFKKSCQTVFPRFEEIFAYRHNRVVKLSSYV